MHKLSAGILVYRIREHTVEVLLAHPGGPFWARKDAGTWSVFKGEPEEGEELLDTARREFREETGQALPDVSLLQLEPVTQKGGKTLYIWAAMADYDAADIISNTFSMEWPPKSGKQQEFPENDRAEWFELTAAMTKMHSGQTELLLQLAAHLKPEYPDMRLPELNKPAPEKPLTLF